MSRVLIVLPETQAQLSANTADLVASLSEITPEAVRSIYEETFPSLQTVSQLGIYALLLLKGLESELDELVAVGVQVITVAVVGVVLPFAMGTAWRFISCFMCPCFLQCLPERR